MFDELFLMRLNKLYKVRKQCKCEKFKDLWLRKANILLESYKKK